MIGMQLYFLVEHLYFSMISFLFFNDVSGGFHNFLTTMRINRFQIMTA